jgi:hypothetical protein
MKNDFISIYTSIEPKERKDFGNYITCFYGNQTSIVSIFDEVKKASSTRAFQAIRQLSVGNKHRLNALADLKKWLFEFLAIKELQENDTELQILSLEALRKRKLFDVFEQKSKQLTIELENQQNPNLWHLLLKARLSHIRYFNTPFDRLQDYQSDMRSLMLDLDNFYFSAKLQYSAELFSRSKVLRDTYDIPLLNPILAILQTNVPIHPIIHDVYLPILHLTKEQSEKAYSQLKQFLIEKPEHDILERQAILLYLINFVISSNIQGKKSAVETCFELYALGLNQSLFIASGYFLPNTFTNIVNVGCYLKKYDWLKAFIRDWSPTLPPSEKEEIEAFALARIYYEEKQFDQVITLLQKVDFKNFNITLNVRVLLLRAYYEQKSPTNLMLDYSNAFYLYIYRSKNIGEALKENTLNFIKLFKALIGNKTPVLLLKELDKKHQKVLCYDWLKEKIDNLS